VSKRRRALLIILGLTSLVVLTVLVYAARFDLNSWKSEIEAAASKGTRMHVTIQGALERKRWFPVTVVVHGLQFQNRDEPVVTLDNVECFAGAHPALRGRLRMGTCTVDGFASRSWSRRHFNLRAHEPTSTASSRCGLGASALLVSRLIARGGAYTFAVRGEPAGRDHGISGDVRSFAIGRPLRESAGPFPSRVSSPGTNSKGTS
jgi:hypothetical protein